MSEAIDRMAATTPTCDEMKRTGQWNTAWDTLLDMDPQYVEKFMSMAAHSMRSGGIDDKTRELISIAVDASCTHLYAPGVKRHIRMALDVGATPAEILSVLQMVSVLGIHSVAMGVPLLAEEMAARAGHRMVGNDRRPDESGL